MANYPPNPNKLRVPFDFANIIFATQATTNDWADLKTLDGVAELHSEGMRHRTFGLFNTGGGGNACDLRVLESGDNGVTWINRTDTMLKTGLADGGSWPFDLGDAVGLQKVQIKSSVAGNPTRVYGWACAN